jgi:D-tyrosyl-tRNA(Tyr) deacylase
MKVLVQRVKQAACVVDGNPISAINQGLLLYVSFNQKDTIEVLPKMAKKVVHLRIFEDEAGKMNRSLLDLGFSILSISQFTLEASTKKGHRPSFTDALNPEEATLLYDQFNTLLKGYGVITKGGAFGEHMMIDAINDGPVTIMMEMGCKDD